MEHIAVSVIVPIYNTKPWLEECVQSNPGPESELS